ncbi:MAG TPA: helicase-related protein [Planctomycetota bacterium]|nr:helicase-related protein [Planctomycetota bacterium]
MVARPARTAPPPAAARTDLDGPLLGLPGVAARRAELYAAAGLRTRRQLLYHLPVRWRLRPPAGALDALRPGEVVAVVGQVERTSLRRRGRRSTVSLALRCEGGGQLTALLFNRSYLAKGLRGVRLWIAGKLATDEAGVTRLVASDYEPLPPRDKDAPAELPLQLPPLPIYRLPAGIPPRVHRKLLAQLLTRGPVPDWRAATRVPGLACAQGEPSLDAALRAIHLPGSLEAARAARQRLAHDEALALSLDVLARRRELDAGRAVALPLDDALHARVLAALPHAPTGAQARALAELRAELSAPPRGRPMARLLQGDVGSGKTLVAFYALLAAALCGRQAALMAPTEVLALQHARGLAELLRRALGEAAPAVAFVAGAQGAAPAGLLGGVQARRALADGTARLAVGTHGLQGARLRFADLALTVVDEQHRFGVLQRTRLREKGRAPHLLVMTATPIPRTLALTAYGELDLTLIDELPPGRAPRRTEIVERAAQPALWQELRAAVARGERGYVVCPSIGATLRKVEADDAPVAAEPQAAPILDAADDADDASVARTLARVRAALPAARVGVVHGRLRAEERDAALQAFREGVLDVLVATVLVEVGLDVPQATWVVIPDASRFGLATLHQIRGRVGRGGRPGRCVLLGPLREEAARARADALVASEDGFALAEQDLQLRGPGEYLGERQSGLPLLRFADLERDAPLIEAARDAAARLIAEQPDAARAHVQRWLGAREELTHA